MNKPYSFLSSAVSVALHPLLMPIYCTLLTLYGGEPYASVAPTIGPKVLILTTSLACAVPLLIIGAFIAFGKIRDLEMSSLKERPLPLMCVSTAIICSIFLINSHTVPRPIAAMVHGEGLLLMIAAFLSMRWKISLHAIGAGALISYISVTNMFLMQDLAVVTAIAFVAAGLIGWARLYEEAHGPRQVLAGFLLGLFGMGIIVFAVMRYKLI